MGIISSGKIWPYAISLAILTFFGAIVFSVTFIVKTTPVERSNDYMMGYNHADMKANDLIEARIEFNKKYKIEYITDTFSQESSIIKYKLTDLDSKPVNSAKFKVMITRPDNHKNNQELLSPIVENGIYTFKSVSLAHPGRWNIMANVSVGNEERFYNLKVDTRSKEAFEY